MQIYENVRSTVKPLARKVDEYSVWISSNIRQVMIEDEYGSRIEYEFDRTRYDKDEYIEFLDNEITATQLALCELYETTGV